MAQIIENVEKSNTKSLDLYLLCCVFETDNNESIDSKILGVFNNYNDALDNLVKIYKINQKNQLFIIKNDFDLFTDLAPHACQYNNFITGMTDNVILFDSKYNDNICFLTWKMSWMSKVPELFNFLNTLEYKVNNDNITIIKNQSNNDDQDKNVFILYQCGANSDTDIFEIPIGVYNDYQNSIDEIVKIYEKRPLDLFVVKHNFGLINNNSKPLLVIDPNCRVVKINPELSTMFYFSTTSMEHVQKVPDLLKLLNKYNYKVYDNLIKLV